MQGGKHIAVKRALHVNCMEEENDNRLTMTHHYLFECHILHRLSQN